MGIGDYATPLRTYYVGSYISLHSRFNSHTALSLRLFVPNSQMVYHHSLLSEVSFCDVTFSWLFRLFPSPLFSLCQTLSPIPPFVCSSQRTLDRLLSIPSVLLFCFIFFLAVGGGGQCFYCTLLASALPLVSFFLLGGG
jgi:hypothetical protein